MQLLFSSVWFWSEFVRRPGQDYEIALSFEEMRMKTNQWSHSHEGQIGNLTCLPSKLLLSAQKPDTKSANSLSSLYKKGVFDFEEKNQERPNWYTPVSWC